VGGGLRDGGCAGPGRRRGAGPGRHRADLRPRARHRRARRAGGGAPLGHGHAGLAGSPGPLRRDDHRQRPLPAPEPNDGRAPPPARRAPLRPGFSTRPGPHPHRPRAPPNAAMTSASHPTTMKLTIYGCSTSPKPLRRSTPPRRTGTHTVCAGRRQPADRWESPMAVGFQLVIDCADPDLLARFWVTALGYELEPPPTGFTSSDDYWRDVCVPEADLGIGADRIIDPDGGGPRHLVPGGARTQDRQEPAPPRRPRQRRAGGPDRNPQAAGRRRGTTAI